jgi:hypothetical protein
MWRGVTPLLARNFTIVCADLRGYERSGRPTWRNRVAQPTSRPYMPLMPDAAASKSLCLAIALANRTTVYEGALARALSQGNATMARFVALRIDMARKDARLELAKICEKPSGRA